MSHAFSSSHHVASSGSTRRTLLAAVLVFGGGVGLGFVWKQGWLPVELLPAQTGVLDPQLEESRDDPPAFLTRPLPLAQVPEGASDAGSASPNDADVLFQQAEPAPLEPTLESMQPFRRVPPASISESPTEAARGARPPADPPLQRVIAAAGGSADLPRTASSRVQPATYTEPVAGAPPSKIEGEESPALPSLDELIADYDRKLENGEVLAAHRLLSQAYWKMRDARSELVERLDRTASAIFFQPQPHFVEPHVIDPGERLETIAANYKVPWEYLSRLNRVDPKRIQAGKRLKVVRGPFSAVVELADFSLTVHLQGYYVRRFPVGIGRDGASPIGKFPVLNKVVNPQYTDPDGQVIAGDDPANPLGERWIDLGSSYGIHGTIDPGSIGKAASRGCIRLNDADVVAVYDFLTVGSEVVIRR